LRVMLLDMKRILGYSLEDRAFVPKVSFSISLLHEATLTRLEVKYQIVFPITVVCRSYKRDTHQLGPPRVKTLGPYLMYLNVSSMNSRWSTLDSTGTKHIGSCQELYGVLRNIVTNRQFSIRGRRAVLKSFKNKWPCGASRLRLC